MHLELHSSSYLGLKTLGKLISQVAVSSFMGMHTGKENTASFTGRQFNLFEAPIVLLKTRGSKVLVKSCRRTNVKRMKFFSRHIKNTRKLGAVSGPLLFTSFVRSRTSHWFPTYV